MTQLLIFTLDFCKYIYIYFLLISGGPEQNAVAVNTSLLIDRLKPYTNYTFYVRAYNNKSASEPSKPIVQMTGEDGNIFFNLKKKMYSYCIFQKCTIIFL